MRLVSRVSAWAVMVAGSAALTVGCAGSDSPAGEPIDSSGGPVDDDDEDSGDSSPSGSGNPTSAGESGGCGGCIDDAGACQPGSFNEACGALGEACAPCSGSTVCAEGVCIEPPACGPDNCGGCCDGDTCVDGNVEDACGVNGGQCNDCPNGATCDGGVCNLSCADSCDGCCNGETCIPLDTTSVDDCGADGEVCQPCGNGFECIDGECLSSACIATCDGCCDGSECLGGSSTDACGSDGMSCQACGESTVCEASGCVPDPMAVWDLIIHEGTVALTDEDGDAWDAFNGLPDPYVRVEVVGMSGETSVVQDNTFPEWNEAVLEGITTVQLQGEVEFSVRDSDIALDGTIGTCVVTVEDEMFNATFQSTCSNSESGFEFWTVSYSIVPG